MVILIPFFAKLNRLKVNINLISNHWIVIEKVLNLSIEKLKTKQQMKRIKQDKFAQLINNGHVQAEVVQTGRLYKAFLTDSSNTCYDISAYISREDRVFALENDLPIVFTIPVNKSTHIDEIRNGWKIDGKVTRVKPIVEKITDTVTMEEETETDPILNFIHKESPEIKPEELIISELKWKYLVRNAMRGRNIMMTGPAGSGKTQTARYAAEALQKPFFIFNLGSTQDPRATLIGNTHFNKDTGTYFSESAFVQAIQTENAIILLDELTRAHPEAWNILMSVLDINQRYLRLDEKPDSPIVKVAEGVSFIGTANEGNEYTSTRVLDRAMRDRFLIIEMDQLDKDQELQLLQLRFPEVPVKKLSDIAEIADMTRKECKSESAKLSTSISTRLSIEIADLVKDGFTISEAAEVGIYPFFSPDGGVDSERTFIKQIVQKFDDSIKEELVK